MVYIAGRTGGTPKEPDMTATQTALTDLLAAAGIDRDRIGDSPDGDTVVIERDDDSRVVVGYDWSADADGGECPAGQDGWPSWVDFTCWSADNKPWRTDGGEPQRAAANVAALVNA